MSLFLITIEQMLAQFGHLLAQLIRRKDLHLRAKAGKVARVPIQLAGRAVQHYLAALPSDAPQLAANGCQSAVRLLPDPRRAV
jgi:hypothetical protein